MSRFISQKTDHSFIYLNSIRVATGIFLFPIEFGFSKSDLKHLWPLNWSTAKILISLLHNSTMISGTMIRLNCKPNAKHPFRWIIINISWYWYLYLPMSNYTHTHTKSSQTFAKLNMNYIHNNKSISRKFVFIYHVKAWHTSTHSCKYYFSCFQYTLNGKRINFSFNHN